MLAALHPDPEARDELFSKLMGPGLLQQAGTPWGVCSFVQASMKNSWCSMQPGSGVCFQTSSGTVPGTPLADLLYQEVQTVFLDGLKKRLRQRGLIAKSCYRQSEAPIPCWADDVAVLMPYCSAEDVVPNLETLVRAADHCSRDTGVRLNYDCGKTEALVFFRGCRSLDVRREYLSCDAPAIPVELSNGETVRVRLVQHYDHLGGRVCHSGSCLDDIKRRAGMTEAVFQRLKKTLLRNPELSSAEKAYLVVSLIVNKFAFGAGLWPLHTQLEERTFRASLMSYFRRSVRPLYGFSSKFLCDDDVCAILDVLSPGQLHRSLLVRQLRVVVLQGPGYLWDTLCDAREWLERAFGALGSVLAVLGLEWHLSAGWLNRLHELQERAEQLRRLPKQYRRKVLRNRATVKDSAFAKARALQDFEKSGGVVLRAPELPECGTFQCAECAQTFKTLAARNAHAARKHGQAAVSTRVAYGTRCEICSREYWTTSRLRRHLENKPGCKAAYDHSDVGAVCVQKACDGAWRPPVATFGPKPFWATQHHLPVVVAPPDAGHSCMRAAEMLGGLVKECGSDVALEKWFGRVLSWMSAFHDEFEGIVTCRQHPWIELLNVAYRLQGSDFVTNEVGIVVPGYKVVADGRHVFIRPR